MAKKINKYILAVKDYDKTISAIISGKMIMPVGTSEYKTLFSEVTNKCDDYVDLKKFIKVSKFAKKDCMHYWEGLLSLGYTLVIVEYDANNENEVEVMCDNEAIKYISAVTKKR